VKTLDEIAQQRIARAWRLIEAATPLDLLAQVQIHMLVHPEKPLPAHLQRRLGKVWEIKS